jgi:hypothetical protein
MQRSSSLEHLLGELGRTEREQDYSSVFLKPLATSADAARARRETLLAGTSLVSPVTSKVLGPKSILPVPPGTPIRHLNQRRAFALMAWT